jgi:hypothetical protein
MFTCVPYRSLDLKYDADSFRQQFNDQFNTTYRTLDHVVGLAAKNFSVYMVSFGSIELAGSSINGPRVGMCAPDVDLYNSQIDSSAKGCRADHGIGKGKTQASCSGAGGAHGGKGGYGGVISRREASREGCQAHEALPYSHGHQARYEGSGGASPLHDVHNAGDGGGIIWISSNGTVNLEGTELLAEGGHGVKFAPEHV